MDQWPFVVAAFGITAVAIGGYVVILQARLRAAESDAHRETSEDSRP